MKKASLLSVRVSEDVAHRLKRLATITEHSKSSLAAQAIEEFVALQEWQLQAIQEGVAAAEKGDVVSHEEALTVLGAWGKKRHAA
jgi:predicted transcriptional regulator